MNGYSLVEMLVIAVCILYDNLLSHYDNVQSCM